MESTIRHPTMERVVRSKKSVKEGSQKKSKNTKNVQNNYTGKVKKISEQSIEPFLTVYVQRFGVPITLPPHHVRLI